jgi:putative glutamine amidotransferase
VSRPLIGITTYAQDARWGVWHLPAALIPLDYVDAVERAGGRALLIPPSEDGVEETLSALDGVVFSGGADVDPGMYGADAHPETDAPQARRDAGICPRRSAPTSTSRYRESSRFTRST